MQQLTLQLREVLDDAVVHQRNAAAAADMGVGIDVVWLAVGGPAGVADAQRAGQIRAVMGQLLENLQATLGLFHLHSVRAADGDAGRVITTVFQPLQSVQQNGGGLLTTYITYDSTHIIISS